MALSFVAEAVLRHQYGELRYRTRPAFGVAESIPLAIVLMAIRC